MFRKTKALYLGLLIALILAQTAQAQVTVRGGRHEGFNRLVFDYPGPVDYQAELTDGELVIKFADEAELDFSGVPVRRLPILGPPVADADGEATMVVVPIKGGTALDNFVLDTRIVFDIYERPEDARRAARARGEQAVLEAGSKIVVQAQSQGRSQEQSQARSQEQSQASSQTEGAATPEAADRPVDDAPASSRGVPDGRAGVAGAVPGEAGQAVQGGSAPVDGVVAVMAQGLDNGVSLQLTFPDEAPPAAFFERAGRVWMVFAGRYGFDTEPLTFDRPPLDGRLTGVAPIQHEQASGLRFSLAVGQSIVARKQDTGWRVELKDSLATPVRPLRVIRQPSDTGTQIFLPVEKSWRVLRIRDETVGDTLAVVPVADVGVGLPEGRRFAQFVLLETAQGIAVQPLSDDILVQRFNNGVAVVGESGLVLTDPSVDPRLQGTEASAGPRRLINLDAWRLGSAAQFVQNRTEIINAISALPDNRRNTGRWDLARFYVAHGEAAEALGVLELMLEEDESLIDSPEFLAVRGLANLMQQRTSDALADLRHPDLLVDPDASLWRVLAAEAEGATDQALESYKLGKDILGFYTPQQQADFRLAAIRAALAERAFQTAEEELTELEQQTLTQAQRGRTLLLRARLAAAQGDIVAALDLFERAAQTPDPGASALARLERIRFALQHEGLDPADAVEQLEQLRYAWRGRDFEIDLLSTLGELYVSIGRYRQGLETLRQAVDYYPDDPRANRLVRQMQRYFEILFLESGEELTPFDAVALFEDFRELTPQGSTGDRIIRRLVDRLVAVDLLDRAASLLEYQVQYRLEGAAQAQIAARLAKVYLLDRKPEQAQQILRATRQERIPEDIRRERRHVEARALAELGRFEEAELVLEDDASQAADLLRNDIFWQAENWPAVAQSAQDLLGSAQTERGLSVEERQLVVRWAIALAFEEQDEALDRLRANWGPLMRDGEFETVFDLFTQQERIASQSPAERARSIANVNAFRSFLANYRADFTEDEDVAAPRQPTAAVGPGQ